MSSRYTWNNYKVLKQEDQEAWHQDVRLHKAYFKFRQTQTIHIVHAGMFSVKNQPFSTPSLSLPLKPIRITTVLFFMKFSAVLYLCLHLKHTILCWYVGQPHWAGESHYCLSLFLKWINLYSQLGFGYRGWYFHDKPPPPTCQNRMRLSSQPAQRQGDDGGNDIPQDILEPRVLLPLNREGAMEYLSFIGSTQKHTLHTIISALQAEKRANTTNWESCKTYRTQKKSFPSSASALGEDWSKGTPVLSQNQEMLPSVCLWSCYSSVMKEHQLGGTFCSHHKDSQYWRN